MIESNQKIHKMSYKMTCHMDKRKKFIVSMNSLEKLVLFYLA